MDLKIYQVDAFASKVFEGNPAAVVPLKEWLPDDVMQKIAMENNLSETAFFVGKDSFHLRWFTPEYEIDLCGHATLASAFVIKNFVRNDISQINFTTEKAGPLRAFAQDDQYTLDFPSRMPQPCKVPEGLFESLGISESVEVLRSRDYFVVLADEDAVKNCKPDFQKMSELDTVGVIVTARGKSADVVSRCFYPGAGIPEDPVTGSAHCNIVPYWSEKIGKAKMLCKQLSPRGGELHCELKDDRVLMTGGCQLYMQGEIWI